MIIVHRHTERKIYVITKDIKKVTKNGIWKFSTNNIDASWKSLLDMLTLDESSEDDIGCKKIMTTDDELATITEELAITDENLPEFTQRTPEFVAQTPNIIIVPMEKFTEEQLKSLLRKAVGASSPFRRRKNFRTGGGILPRSV